MDAERHRAGAQARQRTEAAARAACSAADADAADAAARDAANARIATRRASPTIPRTAAAARHDAVSLASIMVIEVAGAICSPFRHADAVLLAAREWYFAAVTDDDRDIALR